MPQKSHLPSSRAFNSRWTMRQGIVHSIARLHRLSSSLNVKCINKNRTLVRAYLCVSIWRWNVANTCASPFCRRIFPHRRTADKLSPRQKNRTTYKFKYALCDFIVLPSSSSATATAAAATEFTAIDSSTHDSFSIKCFGNTFGSWHYGPNEFLDTERNWYCFPLPFGTKFLVYAYLICLIFNWLKSMRVPCVRCTFSDFSPHNSMANIKDL